MEKVQRDILIAQYKSNPWSEDIQMYMSQDYESVTIKCGEQAVILNKEEAFLTAMNLLNFYKNN